MKLFNKSNQKCPVCEENSSFFKEVDGYNYYNCNGCDLIFIDKIFLEKCDSGNFLRDYNENYWNNELKSAKQRAYDDSIGRLTELIYYARIPIKTIVDIGTGPGFILDFVHENMQELSRCFYGVEKYPPPIEFRTKQQNYFIGGIEAFPKKIDAGVCIEVIEHLTPNMFKNLLSELQIKSKEGSIYIFNTGLSSMVKNGNTNYLDPIIRGHIVSWSIGSISLIANKYNFVIKEIRGKNFAFVLEYKPKYLDNDITDRVWKPLPENINLLKSNNLGSLLKTFGRASIREFL